MKNANRFVKNALIVKNANGNVKSVKENAAGRVAVGKEIAAGRIAVDKAIAAETADDITSLKGRGGGATAKPTEADVTASAVWRAPVQ